MSLSIRRLTPLSIGLLTLALLARYSDGATCASCDTHVEPFFGNLTNENSFRSDSQEYGNSTCIAVETLLRCYSECTTEDGTLYDGFSYLHSADISKEAFILNEWWKVSCDAGCRMADTLVCEHLTYESSAQCDDIAEWRTCVDAALAPYSCDGLCQQSDRWHHAYKLHHEINCADASRQCIDEIKTCMQRVLAYFSTLDDDISYLMSWEFFYIGGLPRDYRCEMYSRAESCANSGSSCGEGDNVESIRHMINNAYGLYCSNSTEDREAACQNSDFTSTSSTSSSSTSSTSSTTSSTSTSTTAPTTTSFPPGPGACGYCDRMTQELLLTASLHNHHNDNGTEFGDIVCGNYTEALNCYDNCTVGEIVARLGEYISPELETLHTQIILSCDPTCRHSDLWICENYLTTDDWCLEEEYDRWLACYENGTVQYDCDKACNVAQRRVNTYKVARQISCSARNLADGSICTEAVNECLNVRFSNTDMNFEKFLTVDITNPLACGYFLSGSDCLNGLIPVFFNDTQNITAYCPSQAEQDIVTKIDSYWRDIYHHEECSSLSEDSNTTYADICDAQAVITATRPTTTLPTQTSNVTGCIMYDEDSTSNPCDHVDPFRCSERDEWVRCSTSHGAATGCNGLCTEEERTNAVTTLISSTHCNLPAGGADFCSDSVHWNCLTRIWAKSQNTYEHFTNPTESLMSWCGKVEEMKTCFHDATYGQIPYFGNELPQPCASHADYMNTLVELTDNLTSSFCSASTWQAACPGSLMGLDDSEDDESSANDACPADITNLEACPSNELYFCEEHFDNWTLCLEQEGIFSDCETLCTKKKRRAFASYTETFMTCHIDAEANDFCWEYVANECLLELFGDRRYGKFTNMHHNQTVGALCRSLDDFTACLEASKTQNVTLSPLATTIEAPCASQPRVIDDTIQRVANAQSNGICQDRTQSFSDVCSESGHRETTEASVETHTTPQEVITRPPSSATPETTTTQPSTLPTTTRALETTTPGGGPATPAGFKVTARISLNADYNSVVGGDPEAVKREIEQGLSGHLNVPLDQVTVMGIYPGSIKVDFEVVTDNTDVATAAADAISVGLSPMTVNGQSYEATTEAVAFESATTAAAVMVDPIGTTPSGERYYTCGECADSLKFIVSYNSTNNTSISRNAYAEQACRELEFITDECFANCIDVNNLEISTDDLRYSQALKLRSLWCSDECPFAGQASCYAGESGCSAIQSDSLDGCLMADYQPKCVGICQQHQRYSLAEKMNHHLSCFPNVDQACATQVSACFNSFRDGSSVDSLISLPKLIGGDALMPGKPLTEICSFLQGPRDCLVGLDFSAVCQDNEIEVRKLADKWAQNYQDVVCQENEGTMTFREKCRSLRNNPPPGKPVSSKKPVVETAQKPAIGPKGQSAVDSSAAQLSTSAYKTMSIMLLAKWVHSHLL